MRIILHIGMHKTGSSSLQGALKGYDDGVTAYAPLRAVNHSIPFFSAFSADHLTYRVFKRQGLSRAEIEALRVKDRSDIEAVLQSAKRDRMIFSGEDISLLSDADKQAMLSVLQQHADDILVVGYFRDPVGFARSALQQDLQGGLSGPKLVQRPKYRRRFETFMRVLGPDRVVLRPFRRDALTGGDVVDDFVAICGLDPARVARQRQNKGLSLQAQQCTFALNRSNPLTSGDAETFRARQRFVRVVGSLFDGPDQVPADYLSDCIDLEDLAWLESVTGVDFSAEVAGVASRSALLADFLSEATPDTIALLASLLKRHGVTGNFDKSFDGLVNRVYYLCLSHHYNSASRTFLDTRVTGADAEALQAIAMKHENGEPLDGKDALYLMGLARKGNPSSRLVRDKIRAWTKR